MESDEASMFVNQNEAPEPQSTNAVEPEASQSQDGSMLVIARKREGTRDIADFHLNLH